MRFLSIVIRRNSKMKSRLISILLVLIIAIVICGEENSFLGPTGLIYTPIAKVLEKKKFNLGMWLDNDKFATVNFGFGVGEGIEIGACEEIPDDGITHTSLNTNWVFIDTKSFYPSVSLGIRDKFNYLVMTENFNLLKGSSASLGLGTDDFDRYRLFGGVKISIHQDWFAVIEYNEHKINAGIRVPYIGLFGVGKEIHSREHNTYFWGFNYQVDLN